MPLGLHFQERQRLVDLEMQLCSQAVCLKAVRAKHCDRRRDSQLKRREDVFWFMVLKVPAHGQLDLSLWAYGRQKQGEVRVWEGS